MKRENQLKPKIEAVLNKKLKVYEDYVSNLSKENFLKEKESQMTEKKFYRELSIRNVQEITSGVYPLLNSNTLSRGPSTFQTMVTFIENNYKIFYWSRKSQNRDLKPVILVSKKGDYINLVWN